MKEKIMDFPLISAEQVPWHFSAKDGVDSHGETMVQISESTEEKNLIKMRRRVFSASTIQKAERIEIMADSHTIFIFDQIVSEIPINIKTKFWMHHNMDLRCNVADKNKIVIRENENGFKFFRLFYQADGEDVLGTSGLLLPDGFSNNINVGLTYCSGLYNFSKKHTMLYGICADSAEKIGKWHFLSQDGFIVQPPTKEGGYRVNISEETLFVENMQDRDDCIKIER